MPRGRRTAIERSRIPGLEEVIREMGQQLADSLTAALMAGVAVGVERAGGSDLIRVSGARLRQSRAGCQVPRCPRRALAKGLCATHYRKARRLDVTDALDARALRELAEDGRKTRFAKK